MGGSFSPEDVVSFDKDTRTVVLLGTLEIAGKNFLVRIMRDVGGLPKIILCCGYNEAESRQCLQDLCDLRRKMIREDYHGFRKLLAKRFTNTILWYLIEGILEISCVFILFLMLRHTLFALLAFIPILCLYLYGILNKLPLVAQFF